MADIVMGSELIGSLDRQSLPDKIAGLLRRALIDGTLSPGARLVELDLAHQLGVSRSALREALRILQWEGLVETRHNRGTYVAQVSEEDVEEISSLRGLLEAYAVSQVAERATHGQVERLRALFDDMMKAAEAGDYRRTVDLDLRLHKMVWEMCGHRRLFRVLCSMESQIRMFLAVHAQVHERLVDTAADHRGIVEAIRYRRGAEAGELMKRHIESAVEAMRSIYRTPQGGR